MPLPRATNYRSAGLSQPVANQYIGNAFVYVLASRIDPNLCKIGKGNPTTRCDHWNNNSPHGGMLNNNLSVFAAYGFDTEADALEYESQAHAIYNFVNLNPNAAGGEQEFFAVPPQQATATLDILHGQYAQAALAATAEALAAERDSLTAALAAEVEQARAAARAAQEAAALAAKVEQARAAEQARLIAEARQDGYNNAPLVIAQREAAERAQRETAKREAAERAKREAAERAAAEAKAEACRIEMERRTEIGKRKAAEREQRLYAEAAAAEERNLKREKVAKNAAIFILLTSLVGLFFGADPLIFPSAVALIVSFFVLIVTLSNSFLRSSYDDDQFRF
jgi:hypothetical protein